MQEPNQIVSKVILLYRGKRAVFQLTLKNIFLVLILGNEAQEVFLYKSKGSVRSRS